MAARKDKTRTGTKVINPNDPQENPDLLLENSSSRPNSEEHVRKGSTRSTQRGKSREDNDFRNYMKSPARNENVGNKIANDFPNQRPGSRGIGSSENYRRAAKQSVGSEQSIERSPLHRKAAAGATGFASPSCEGKNSYDSSHGTPGRSRLKPSRSDEIHDRGAAVPKFGAWDENNPASADGYTHIFNIVREERLGGSTSSPNMPRKVTYPARKRTNDSISYWRKMNWRKKAQSYEDDR